VSRRTRNIVLIILAAVVLISIASYTLFNIGGTTPGSGEGDEITSLRASP
jgi:hypothetical protein